MKTNHTLSMHCFILCITTPIIREIKYAQGHKASKYVKNDLTFMTF